MAEQSNEAAAQGNGQQVRVHVDEQRMQTSYANGFRTHVTNEEVIVDFGMNLGAQPVFNRENGESEANVNAIRFQVSDRVVLNYYTAKRLALSLGQIIRQYEERFGELKLNR